MWYGIAKDSGRASPDGNISDIVVPPFAFFFAVVRFLVVFVAFFFAVVRFLVVFVVALVS